MQYPGFFSGKKVENFMSKFDLFLSVTRRDGSFFSEPYDIISLKFAIIVLSAGCASRRETFFTGTRIFCNFLKAFRGLRDKVPWLFFCLVGGAENSAL